MSESQPRRVLFLADVVRGSHGGTEGQMHVLAAGLPPSWQPTLWVLKPSEHVENGGFPGPARCIDFPAVARPWTFWRIRRLAREVRREGFDLIQTFLADASVIGPMIGARAGVPVLVSRRDMGFWQTPGFLEVLRRTGRLASGYLANCEAVKARVVELEHAHPATVHVVHNGQPASAFDAPADEGLRARLGIPPAAPIVVLLANYKPLKRPQDLVAALGLLKDKLPDAHALLIGHDYDAATVERWCSDAGLGGRVHVEPTRGPVVPLLKNAAVGVLCSTEEGLSNAVLEYMGCGLPVVATNVGGIPEMVTDGVNGFLCASGDVAALADSLERVLLDRTLAQSLGSASRLRFEERFGAERMVGETATVYERILAQGGAGGGALKWEIVRDMPALEALAGPWDALLGPTQFFLGPDWVLGWLRMMGDRVRPHVLVARDAAGTLVGLLPLAATSRGVVATCAMAEGTVHVDVLAAPGRAREVAEGALETLVREGPRRVRLQRLAEGGALRLAIRARRWTPPFTERLSTSCPYLEAKGTYDEFLRARFATKRKMMRYKVRRAAGERGENVRRVKDPAECAAAIDTLFDLHARRFEDAGKETVFAGPDLRIFHVALATALAAKDRLALTILEEGGRPIAVQYAIRAGGTMYVVQTGLDPKAAKLSPSQVLLMVALEQDVFGAGLSELDFLWGAQDYKMAWSTGVRREYDVDLYRSTILGRSGCRLRGVAAMLKSRVRSRVLAEEEGARRSEDEPAVPAHP